MAKRVYITGIGIISAIGNNAEDVEENLLAERTGITGITLFPTIHQNKIPIAEVKLSNQQLAALCGTKSDRFLTRTTLLGMIAGREALRNSGFSLNDGVRTGLISATTVGGMDHTEIFYKEYYLNPAKGSLRDVVSHDCGDSTERISEYLGISDFVTTVSTACSSSANSIMFGARLIKSGMFERVVAGGTDSLTRFTLNGFNTLMILDKHGCKPFDENRAGLTIGEGAAFLVLESEELVRKMNKTVLAELTGYGNANDAYHQTASSPEGIGAVLAMEKAFQVSGLNPSAISYINVHGTGTQNNDLSEGFAIEKVFGTHIPYFSSTKSYTGHTLGAAGAIEAVISILAIKNDCIFPNLNWTTPMKELSIRPAANLIKNYEVNHVLSNSFGFGGNNSTLILSRG
jgi:3-oxoacyl-(acyl-carrier-protein) synthase